MSVRLRRLRNQENSDEGATTPTESVPPREKRRKLRSSEDFSKTPHEMKTMKVTRKSTKKKVTRKVLSNYNLPQIMDSVTKSKSRNTFSEVVVDIRPSTSSVEKENKRKTRRVTRKSRKSSETDEKGSDLSKSSEKFESQRSDSDISINIEYRDSGIKKKSLEVGESLPQLDEKPTETDLVGGKIKNRRETFELEKSTLDIELPDVSGLETLDFSNVTKTRGGLKDTVEESKVTSRIEKSPVKNTIKNNSTFELVKQSPKNNSTFELDKTGKSLKRRSKSEGSILVKNNSTFEMKEATLKNTPTIPIKQVQFVTPPSSTSTPAIGKGTSLLKKTLKKGNSFSESVLKPKPTPLKASVKKMTPTKMPNFALIHKKAFEKMENLSEHLKRREQRAKLLLSGQKPLLSSLSKSQTKSVEKKKDNAIVEEKVVKSKKQLQFAETNAPAKPAVSIASRIQSSKLPVKTPVIAKPVLQPKASQENLNRVNLKLKKEEEMKIVANKAHAPKQNTATRREALKGVRSNRRFDLLMKMRSLK